MVSLAELVKGLAVCIVNLVASVISMVAERDFLYKASAEVPAVLPHELVSLRNRAFRDILKIQIFRFRMTR